MEEKAAEVACETVVNGIVGTVVKEWNYIYKFNDYVGIVKKKAKVLKGLEVDVVQAVNVTIWGGKFVGGDVIRLLGDAIATEKESEKILKEAEKVKNGLWKGRLNVVRRFCLSRKAEKLGAELTDLITHAQTYYVKGDPGVIPAAMLPAVKALPNHDGLESRKLLLDKVMKAVMEDDDYMIGIHGMAGVGKTALADEVKTRVLDDKVFDAAVKRRVLDDKVFDAAVKVPMSNNPSVPEIQDVVASSLGLKLEARDDEEARARRLQKRLTDGSKTLVILDNIWYEVPLHRIGLPHHGMQKGCKVLFTSRNRLILQNMGANQNFEVKPLERPEAQQLFMKIACTMIPPDIKIAGELIDKCGGLPLAICTIASRLVNKEPQVWMHTLQNLKNSAATNKSIMDNHIYASIKVSYDLLESKSDAQRLLLLCCLFPGDKDIPTQKLVRYFKGLKLLYVADSLVEISCYVLTLLDELITCSLLLRGDKGTTVKINHVVRAVCLSISSNEDTNRLYVKHTPKLKTWPYDKEEKRSYTSMSLTFSDQMDSLDVPDGLVYPDLELLRLQFHGASLKLSENTFKGMKEVRVLDFKRMQVWGIRISILKLVPALKMLTNLRTLCIEFCDLRDVDLSQLIESLKHLEVLSFFCSEVVSLPNQLQELTDLKMLDLRCDGDVSIPSKVLPKLKLLEELYLGNYANWAAPADVQNGTANPDSISITELSQLPLLRVLQVRVRDPKLLLELEKEAWFEGLTNFQIVATRALQTFREHEIGKSITLDDVQWNPLLKAKIQKLLKITECLTLECTAFRNLFVEFSGLKNLQLYDCGVKYVMDAEDTAETLNQLNRLKIGHMKNLKALCEKELPSNSLVKLETLELDTLNLLEYLWRAQPDSGCLGNLRFLKMSYCATITSVFPYSVAKVLVQLESLAIKKCEKLRWIVSKEEDGKPSDNIVLQKLSNLSLDELPNFCSFFPDSSVVLTSVQVTSENSAKHNDQKSGCSCFTLKPSTSKDIPVPTSNVFNCQPQQVLENDVQRNNNKPIFNKLVELSSMKKLLIGSIHNMKHVVDDDTSTETVKKIKKMDVINCRNLLRLAASKHSIRSLQDLEQVNVEKCESMEALFNFGEGSVVTPSTEAVLSKLAFITVSQLNKLNQVLLKVPENTSCFENLKSLDISGCGSLEYIFSVSVAKMLGKLEDLKVRDCAMVKEILEIDGGNNEETTDLIEFSCLRLLHLDNLASMSSFSSGNHDFNFPILKDMLVRECPRMHTFCSGRVRARLLYEVTVGSLCDMNEPVPDEDHALNQTITKLYNVLIDDRRHQQPAEIEGE